MVDNNFNHFALKALDDLQRALEDHRSAFEDRYMEEVKLKSRVESTITNLKAAMTKSTLPANTLMPVEGHEKSPACTVDEANTPYTSQLESGNNSQFPHDSPVSATPGASSSWTGGSRSERPAVKGKATLSFSDTVTIVSKEDDAEKPVTSLSALHAKREIQEFVLMDGTLALEPEECVPPPVAGPIQKRLLGIVNHRCFEATCSIVILLNTIGLTVSIEYSARNYQQHDPPIFGILETCFLAFYVLEAVLRLAAHRMAFFTGADRKWHFLDLFMIACSLPDRIVALSGAPPQVNVSFMRILRTAKMLRIGRVGRLVKRSMRIRTILALCQQGVGEALPILGLVCMFIYLFALCILSTVGNFLQEEWQHINPDLKNALVQDWGSLSTVMHSCYMISTGGILWHDLVWSLREVGTISYIAFLLFIAFNCFFVANIITSIFIHILMASLESADKFRVSVQMERAKRLVSALTHIFGAKELTYQEFYQHLVEEGKFLHFLRNVMGTSYMDADFLFFTLSASGTEPVLIETFVLGCIELKGPVTKMDLMQMKTNIDVALEEHAEEHHRATVKFMRSPTDTLSVESMDNQLPINPTPATEDLLVHIASNISCRLNGLEKQREFCRACLCLLRVVKDAKGGCGFLLTTHKGFASMKHQHVDFQVVDRDSRYQHGYMTQLLRDRLKNDLESKDFQDALIDFTSHGEADRWPEGHEASGLPKDGFTVMSTSGRVLKGASRIVGLQKPPIKWDGVGTRHLAALAVCWALRLHPSLVIVRSDSGSIHWLYADGTDIHALRLVEEDFVPTTSCGSWAAKTTALVKSALTPKAAKEQEQSIRSL